MDKGNNPNVNSAVLILERVKKLMTALLTD